MAKRYVPDERDRYFKQEDTKGVDEALIQQRRAQDGALVEDLLRTFERDGDLNNHDLNMLFGLLVFVGVEVPIAPDTLERLRTLFGSKLVTGDALWGEETA